VLPGTSVHNRKSRGRKTAGRRNYPEAVPNGKGRKGDGPKQISSVRPGPRVASEKETILPVAIWIYVSAYSTGLVPRSRLATSVARNLAMCSINFTGTGSENGKRIVPLLTL